MVDQLDMGSLSCRESPPEVPRLMIPTIPIAGNKLGVSRDTDFAMKTSDDFKLFEL